MVIMVPDMSLRASRQANSSVRTYPRLYGTPSLCAPCLAGAHGDPATTTTTTRVEDGRRREVSPTTRLAEANRGRGDLAWNCSAAPSARSLPRRLGVTIPIYAAKHFGKKRRKKKREGCSACNVQGYRLFPQRVRFVQRASRAHAAAGSTAWASWVFSCT